MDQHKVLADALDRGRGVLHRAVNDMPVEALAKRGHACCRFA